MIQIETAMGAAIEVFEGARTIEVGRDRFVPVKTTNDLLVLRSDVYDLGEPTSCSTRSATALPYVDLDGDYYKLVGEFDKRFPEGAPSLREAASFTRRRATGPSAAASQVVGEVEPRRRRSAPSGSTPARCWAPMAEAMH